ncbi:hypothetical protein RRG08_039992 [Elysia crispata]|uniref:Uncharacterized protein n=1 Tax=Elysia crispata TaxID=231223 RepID=A0AAE0Z9A8_9GAST|nr:hypothetical protein RRG08_039992 [Elysia crispata]
MSLYIPGLLVAGLSTSDVLSCDDLRLIALSAWTNRTTNTRPAIISIKTLHGQNCDTWVKDRGLYVCYSVSSDESGESGTVKGGLRMSLNSGSASSGVRFSLVRTVDKGRSTLQAAVTGPEEAVVILVCMLEIFEQIDQGFRVGPDTDNKCSDLSRYELLALELTAWSTFRAGRGQYF